MSEARTGKRFPLELPIKIHKQDTGGESTGVTGNLSAAGVYIRADAALDVGSPVEFEIALPPEMTGAKENVVIQCRGRVVRTDDPAVYPAIQPNYLSGRQSSNLSCGNRQGSRGRRRDARRGTSSDSRADDDGARQVSCRCPDRCGRNLRRL